MYFRCVYCLHCIKSRFHFFFNHAHASNDLLIWSKMVTIIMCMRACVCVSQPVCGFIPFAVNANVVIHGCQIWGYQYISTHTQARAWDRDESSKKWIKNGKKTRHLNPMAVPHKILRISYYFWYCSHSHNRSSWLLNAILYESRNCARLRWRKRSWRDFIHVSAHMCRTQ